MSSVRHLVPKGTAAVAVACIAALAVGSTASAHVTIAEPVHVAGAYTLLTFGVPHGCEESSTTQVRIQIPETIPQVTPTVNANWDVEKVMTQLDEPIEAGHGEQITERVSEVVYTAKTPLPHDLRDAMVLSLRIPDDAAGQTLYFPTIQTCEVGETAWIEIPEAGQDGEELEAPAPSIQIVAAEGADGAAANDGAADGEAAGAEGAAGAEASGEAAGAVVDAEDDDDSDASNGLAIAALVVGLVGLGVGGFALARTRR
jgi:uncharacterized protein YcnI